MALIASFKSPGARLALLDPLRGTTV